MSSHDRETIPPQLLIGAGILIAVAMLGTGLARLTDVGVQSERETVVVESILLHFKDDADGGVSVYAHESGDRIWNFPPETGGFVRTAMRAVVHARKVRGIGPETPFQLSRTSEGRLLLVDPETGRTVGLEAFGSTNAGDFAQLLGQPQDIGEG